MTRSARVTALAALVLSVVGCTSGGSSPSSEPTSTSSPASTAATPAPQSTYTAPPPSLPVAPVALSTDPAPWLPPAVIDNGAQSADYVRAAGFAAAPEMLRVHYHAHLDITVDGKAVEVPPYIGYETKGNNAIGLAPLHTHTADGIVHIENNVPATFVLEQFFIEWGVRFTPTCMGSYCSGNGKELAVFVNGTRYDADPTKLILKAHQEIAIEYGDTGKLPKPPASFTFPSGY